jgi:succinyl-CoA synthetase alpha subunit
VGIVATLSTAQLTDATAFSPIIPDTDAVIMIGEMAPRTKLLAAFGAGQYEKPPLVSIGATAPAGKRM